MSKENQEICGTCWHYYPTGQSCKHGLCCWRPEESVPDWFDVDKQNNGRLYDSPACDCYSPQEVVEKPTPLITDPTHITYRNYDDNISVDISMDIINGTGTPLERWNQYKMVRKETQ